MRTPITVTFDGDADINAFQERNFLRVLGRWQSHRLGGVDHNDVDIVQISRDRKQML